MPELPDVPLRVLMDLRSDCNLKCPDCQVHGKANDPRFADFVGRSMPFGKVIEILDELAKAEKKPLIQPLLWSEPLLARDFRPAVRAMKDRGMAVTVNTNGLLLTKDMARFLVDVQIDCVTISIDAVTPETLRLVRGIDKLDRICRAFDDMIAARGEKDLPRIGVSFTLHETNKAECDEFVAKWVKKADFVRVQELFIDGVFPHLTAMGERQPCPVLYQTMVINANGDVSICCLDTFGRTVVGNVFEQGVRGVWLGEAFNWIRRMHETGRAEEIALCRNCVRWAADEYREEVADGLLIRRSSEMTYYNRTDRIKNWTGNMLANHRLSKK